MQPAEPQRRIPRMLMIVTALLLAGRLLSPAPKNLVLWVSLEAAAQAAEQSKKPILYDFSAEWCSPCKKLDRDVFARADTAKLINEGFVPVKVMDREREEGKNSPNVQELQGRHKVSSFPTLVVARADGSQVAQTVGFGAGASGIRSFLKRSLGEAHRPRATAGP